MCSAGLRVGAIPLLRIKDLEPIDKYNIYKITVYAKSIRSRYFSFCTPEARQVLDNYFDYRKRWGERLEDETPVFRTDYNAQRPQPTPANNISVIRMQGFVRKIALDCGEGEDSLAYFKRWVILRFEAVFQGDKQNRNLIKELTTPENLSGLLNLALVGIKLLERDGFENIPIEVIRAEYERRSMSLSTFIDTQCVINLSKKEYFIPKGDFYDSYLKYYKDNPGIDIDEDGLLSPEKVEVELANYNVFEKRITIDKKKRDCYYGIITLEEANRRNQEVLERQKQSTL